MLNVSRLCILFVLGAAIVAAQPTCVFACSCRPPGTPAQELGQADAVFLATVVDVNAPSGPIRSSADSTTVTLDVAKVWKGQVTRTLVLITPGSSASCGVSFEQGKAYVVYGRVSEGALTTNLCSRTRPIGDATEDLAALGPGQPPEANIAVPPQLPATGTAGSAEGAGRVQLLLVAFGLLAVGSGVMISAVMRRRTP